MPTIAKNEDLCQMRKLSADFILSPNGHLLRDHTLVIEKDGEILDLLPHTNEDAEFFEGILSPGFINTHCHLELSHFKNKISRNTGLEGFIFEFVRTRRSDDSDGTNAIEEANNVMWENGIQGVGDICNNDSTFSIKNKSKIRYHSFVEIFSMQKEDAEKTFLQGIDLLQKAIDSHQHASIIPHAPYSSSPQLFELINNHHQSHPSLWGIHNQESESENEMFMHLTGKLLNMFNQKGIDMSWFSSTGKNSLQTISKHFPLKSKILLVHNTFTRASDINFLKENNLFDRIWLSLCPKANLYIEGQLPDVPMLQNQNCKITIGTDSLASNDTLSILDEMIEIQTTFPEISIETLLTFATKNGADYFGWNDLGAFTPGARPGIINITNSIEKFNKKSKAIRII